MPKPDTTDDLQTSSNLKRIDDLEGFRKEFDGEGFYAKVTTAIQKSKDVEGEIKKVAWQTAREKIVWILLGGVGIILTDLILRAIPHILNSFK